MPNEQHDPEDLMRRVARAERDVAARRRRRRTAVFDRRTRWASRGYPIGMRLIDTSGTGYAARVSGKFNDVMTVNGKRVGDLDPNRTDLLVRSARHGRVLSLVPDLSDGATRRLLAASTRGAQGRYRRASR